MRCQCQLLGCDARATLEQEGDSEGACGRVASGDIGELSAMFAQFFCKPESAPKSEVYSKPFFKKLPSASFGSLHPLASDTQHAGDSQTQAD